MSRGKAITVAVVVAFVATAPALAAKKVAKTRQALQDALDEELGLTRRNVDVHKAIEMLDRERASVRYTAAVLDDASRESVRRLRAYHRVREPRKRNASERARALYKMARGGAARLAFDDTDREDRLATGRSLQFVVRHDLEQLEAHRRSEERAEAELVAATRELQALAAATMVESMQEHVLVSAAHTFDAKLQHTTQARRKATWRTDKTGRRSNRVLMRLVRANRIELEKLRGLDGAAKLVRPVPGRVVGGFGEQRDPVLKVPVVRNGVELRARVNYEVRAMAPGRVVLVEQLPGYENVVVLDHGAGQYSLTGRLWRLRVQEGDDVEGGTVLGRVAPKGTDDGLGSTVYVELRHGEKPIDPTRQIRRARKRKEIE